MAGRKPSIDSKVIDEEIVKHKTDIVGLDKQIIPGIYDRVWQTIASNLNAKYSTKITAASVRVRVALNRNDLKYKLGLLSPTEVIYSPQDMGIDKSFSGDENDISDMENNVDKLTFCITFSEEEWESMKPHPTIYNEKYYSRTYLILSPYKWSNIVQEHFFLHTRLPCSISFKKANVHKLGNIFVSVHGRCSSCGSIFVGTINEIPAVGTRVLMKCTYTGLYNEEHNNSKRRRLTGSEKQRAINAMVNCHQDPSVYYRTEANRLMIEGDTMAAQIPSMACLRQTKSKALSALRLHQDPIISLQIMKYNERYDCAIRDIGFNKFFVHFWTDLQLKIYREQCLKNTVPTISFDATGGICKKIKRHNNSYSGSIFLYEGVMQVKNQSFTALSMLSEQHDNLSITLWLKRWLRCNIKPPKISITDQSLALMSATVQAFTKYNSLENYLKACFSLVRGEKDFEIPSCFIRNDVNHFIHLITQWKPLKHSNYTRTKQLFGRSMGLLVGCKSMKNARQILEALFIIALSKYDGSVITNTGRISKQDTPCAKSKKYLQLLISTSSNLDIFYNETEDMDLEEDALETDLQNFDSSNSFKDWAKSIHTKCEVHIREVEGEFDNAQYIPEIVPLIINIMKLFPCWSSIMVSIFGYGEKIASSSRIECNFNNIKNRVFKNENMPIRVDDFLGKLVDYYRGDHLIVQAKQNEKIIEKSDDDESNYEIEIQIEKSLNSCTPCKNGDFPTGLHRCRICNKGVHLFGCSVEDPYSVEGCGETRICLTCREMNELSKENNSIENWKNKGKSPVKSRSAKSYLEKQPGFEHVNLNKKGSITAIAFLKNGSSFNNKPIYVPGFEKVLLTNTCSADSLLSIIAISAAESECYHKFLSDEQNSTSIFVLQMIDNKASKELYVERVYLLALHYIATRKELIGGIELIDTADTAASISKKLLEKMPSYIQLNCCMNSLCFEPENKIERFVVSLNAIDGYINLQEEIDKFFVPSITLCTSINCRYDRQITFKPMKHIVVELLSIPKDFQRSVDNAGLVMWKLDDVPKQLKVQDITFYLRGIVAFNSSNKNTLRNNIGHYMAYCIRSNGTWECYNDVNDKMKICSSNVIVNIEVLFYTM